MSMFNTLVAKYLVENSREEFEATTLTELEIEFVDVLAQGFNDQYNRFKDQILKTVTARKKSITLKDGLTKMAPAAIVFFRSHLDQILDKQIRTLLETTTTQPWDYYANREFYTYLSRAINTFLDEVIFYADPESSEDLCLSIVDTKHLSEFDARYGCIIPADILSKLKQLYYPNYIESSMQKAFKDCLLYCIRSCKTYARMGEVIPYFQNRSKLLLKSIASKHGGLEDLLDY
jgi:hypothetical protein